MGRGQNVYQQLLSQSGTQREKLRPQREPYQLDGSLQSLGPQAKVGEVQTVLTQASSDQLPIFFHYWVEKAATPTLKAVKMVPVMFGFGTGTIFSVDLEISRKPMTVKELVAMIDRAPEHLRICFSEHGKVYHARSYAEATRNGKPCFVLRLENFSKT